MREIRTLRCDVEGTGNVAWSRYCDTRRRKSELTVNTNFDLNRRASPRPYLGERGGEIPPRHSTVLFIASRAAFMRPFGSSAIIGLRFSTSAPSAP